MNIHDTDTVALDAENGSLVIIDQTLLPARLELISLRTTGEIWEAIKNLRVRGAPAIGAAAACGYYLAARNAPASGFEGILEAAKSAGEHLASSRPTAVNLFYAIERMENRLLQCGGMDSTAILGILLKEAQNIISEDIQACKAIGENALSLFEKGWGILTHCNAGKLCAIRYGTATAPIYLGQERGYNLKVYADETRPLLQGARLTAYELKSAGVDVTLICDNMAAALMKSGRVQAVITGCDRVAANGDTANKIGTLGVAVLAKRYGIPFYIAAPRATIDLKTKNGEDIVIEERDGAEVTDMWYEKPMAPSGVSVFNPAFDVTDAELISAIITEQGIAYPPYTQSLANLRN